MAPVPDVEPEAEDESASTIASMDPEPETNGADPEPGRRTTVGVANVGRGVPFLVTITLVDAGVFVTRRKAPSTTPLRYRAEKCALDAATWRMGERGHLDGDANGD
ncbi:hypothetical protein GN244_ATG09617 [Phytophthora infestans]|uniref:Uncharacterized protein n=1 Tax=Phytophthora infestans TaxID=4787 RepID=A0A833WJS2_PHYIN|nr:hypothetical protein GN244_ATG09617 [Phytophthora infestans]